MRSARRRCHADVSGDHHRRPRRDQRQQQRPGHASDCRLGAV